MGRGSSGGGMGERLTATLARGNNGPENERRMQALVDRAQSATWRTFQYRNALDRATRNFNQRMLDLRPGDRAYIREGQLSTTNRRLRRAQEAELARDRARARYQRAGAIERSVDRQLYRRQRMEDMSDIIASGERSASQIRRIAGARAERRYQRRRSRR